MNHIILLFMLSFFVSFTFAANCKYVTHDSVFYTCLFSSDAHEITEITGDLPDEIDESYVRIVEEDRDGPNRLIVLNNVFSNKFSNLENLSLTNFQIRNITANAFINSSTLWVINLSNNFLRNISLSSSSVRTLNLAHNPIVNITKTTFVNLPNLNQLDMTNCSLHNIHAQAFNSMTLLNDVNFQLNQLTNFSFEIFINAQNSIREINLSYNVISRLEHSRQTLHELRKLDLSRNLFWEFPMSGIRDLINLRELSLERNMIRILSHSNHNLHNLMTLNVASNHIFAIDINFVNSFSPTMNFIVEHNQCVDDNLYHHMDECFRAYEELRNSEQNNGMSIWLFLLIIGLSVLILLIFTFAFVIIIGKIMTRRKNETVIARQVIPPKAIPIEIINPSVTTNVIAEQRSPPPSYRDIEHGNQSVFP